MSNVKAFVTENNKPNGDSFLVGVYTDMVSAVEAAQQDKSHSTAHDIKGATWSVSVYSIPCEDGQTIGEAFSQWSMEQCWMSDPIEYKEI